MHFIERTSRLPAAFTAVALVLATAVAASPARAQYDSGTIYGRSAEAPGHVGKYDYGARMEAPGHWELRQRFDQYDQDRYRLGYDRPQWSDRAFREHSRRGSEQGPTNADDRAAAGEVYSPPSESDRTFDNRATPDTDYIRHRDEVVARDLYPQRSSTFDPEAVTGRPYRGGQQTAQAETNIPIDRADSQFAEPQFDRFGFGATRWSSPFGAEDLTPRVYRR
ncbi:MAG: hypothetical protein CMM50_13925 [Rhodospirillaceae bacterium]|nr:hypothetical protein [Rhodospirillaceae bacterium]